MTCNSRHGDSQARLRGASGATGEQLDRENDRVRREFFPHHDVKKA